MSNVKYQTENYALINECNVRKEQIAKKKRILQEMVNSVRETQVLMAHLQTNPPPTPALTHSHSQPRAIPFLSYEQKQQVRKEQSESTLVRSKTPGMQVRRMLEVQRLGSPESRVLPARRIQTANLKKKVQESSHEQVSGEEEPGWLVSKPQTAGKRSRGAQQEARRLFSRNKSSSKPTTCTSHSKYSLFV
jgi:hypothetical protein